jgi:hypothetical protein
MNTTIHPSNSRGHANHGWLDTHHTFSFANYYNPERIHFGHLRVLNDDIIAPGTGFGKHPHDNMEIISIPIEGQLMHEDSMGHKQVIAENEVQVMSAGTGIFHSEYNASEEHPANFLQIWILPEKKNIEPVYKQMFFNPEDANNQWQVLVDSDKGPLRINQHAKISRIKLGEGNKASYQLNEKSHGSYLFLIEGKIKVANNELSRRDGIGIQNTTQFELLALENSSIINIEV